MHLCNVSGTPVRHAQCVRLSAVRAAPTPHHLGHPAARHQHHARRRIPAVRTLLESAAGQADYSDVSLSPDLIELALCKLRSNESVSATARALGVSRAKLYRAAAAHAELKALLPTNTGTAAPRTPQQPVVDDQPGDRPRFDEDLTREQTTELCRSLGRLRNLRDAALDAGVDLFPNRIRPRDLPREARNLLRDALEIVQAARLPKPPGQEAQALTEWLNGSPWPLDIDLDAAELRRLSPRAADDLERTLRARVLVAARHRARSTTPRAEPEDPSMF